MLCIYCVGHLEMVVWMLEEGNKGFLFNEDLDKDESILQNREKH